MTVVVIIRTVEVMIEITVSNHNSSNNRSNNKVVFTVMMIMTVVITKIAIILEDNNAVAMACRYVVERRMRVVTKALHVAQDPATVYEHASPANVLCLLMHKISRAAAEEGVWNARQLLQDWLVRALANYNTNMHPKPTAGGTPLQVSVPCAPLCRSVYCQ